MAYLPIEDHGVIGDLHTIALVGSDGTIDWCCLPHFDSPSVFAGILDDEKGGWFRLKALGCVRCKQQYLPDSAILVTRAYTQHGVGQIEDFMPVLDRRKADRRKVHQIVRRVSCARGEVQYDLECRPAFDYGRRPHRIHLKASGAIFETDNKEIFGLSAALPLEDKGEMGVTTSFRLKEGECLSFIFFVAEGAIDTEPFSTLGDPDEKFEATWSFWQEWASRCTYKERWSTAVYRSAITLKLLTFSPTGAIVAAPTMGLPETVGGSRNWDYRYTWIRDAAFTLYALMRIGYNDEAGAFMEWLIGRYKEVDMTTAVPLHLMYGIHGEEELEETTLDHLKGYRTSKPVRLGNRAYKQLQLDIYGELLDSIYLYNKYGTPISYDHWRHLRRIVDWVGDNWNQPDEGIWETRGGRHNFVFSRLMCWVALDRASRMSLKYSLPGNHTKWIHERDKIYDEIMSLGWNEKRGAFRQHYKTEALDAANLLMPLVKFISPTDPRMLSTLEATLDALTTDSLVYRYDPQESPDGLSGREGTFCMCTFWLVECLTRAGRLRQARLIFERMLSYANHLGLFAEQIGQQGEALGNFPQALTHLSLISAAYNLNRALAGKS
ncbi:glycoside hydrolase family 15 protein [Acidobacteria bacterium AH-259-A15]|nr:glycoside hydrolase family 15 protein [Acidobacteria bacterium AH-259-A15]